MNIVVIMLGRKLGGIEQVALDYCTALQHEGCNVLCITDSRAAINPKVQLEQIPHKTIRNFGAWDRLAAAKIRSICRRFKADAIISHGNRALNLVALAHYSAPHITVAHNYLNKHFHKADAVLCITQALRQHLITKHQIKAERCFHMPNLRRMTNAPERTQFHTPVRIGTIGRMVHKKGFDVWLQALALLRDEGIMFEAQIAGDGEERQTLETLCHDLRLNEWVTFQGWVSDSQTFLSECDIFCLPSRHEPFGIVLLEAMNAALPLIATKSEGPSEIITPEIGTLVPMDNAAALAEALHHAITHEAASIARGVAAYKHGCAHYDLLTQAHKLHIMIEQIIGEYLGK